jgi:hypothetical protein
VCVAAAAAVAGDQPSQAWAIGFAQQPVELRPLEFLDGIPEDALHRRALVRDYAVCVEHRDQVARVCDEGAEPRLALAAVKVGRERRALHCQRDLEAQSFERVRHLLGDTVVRVGDQEAADLGADREGSQQHGVSALEAELVARLARELEVRDPHAGRVCLQPGEGRLGQPPVAVLGRCGDDRACIPQ